MKLLIPAVLLTSLCHAIAQTTVLAPDVSAANVVDSIAGVEGLDLPGRAQILLDESWVGSANVGSSLTSIAFVRDSGFAKALGAGSAQVTLTVSVSPRLAVDTKSNLEVNGATSAAARIVVYSGAVSLPASADLTGRQPSWSDPQDVITIPFTSPWTYPGGTLCLDLVGTPVAGDSADYWPVEAALELDAVGVSQLVGSSCREVGPFWLAPNHLVAGSTAPFAVEGPDDLPVAFLFGAPIAPVDLALLGSTGCALHVDPFAAFAASFDRSANLPGSLSRSSAVLDLDLPNSSAILSMSLRAQLVTLTVPLETSNGLDFTVGSSAPMLGAAYVRAKPGATRGRVSTSRVPVVRLTFF